VFYAKLAIRSFEGVLDNLLHGHATALSPSSSKGFLTKGGAGSGDCLIMLGALFQGHFKVDRGIRALYRPDRPGCSFHLILCPLLVALCQSEIVKCVHATGSQPKLLGFDRGFQRVGCFRKRPTKCITDDLKDKPMI
jgi:hypothetical protein